MIKINRFDRLIIWWAESSQLVRIATSPVFLPLFTLWWHTSSKKFNGDNFLEAVEIIRRKQT